MAPTLADRLAAEIARRSVNDYGDPVLLALLRDCQRELEAKDTDLLEFRKYLWLTHDLTHIAVLYGDDGEMQCNHATCRCDFKRDSVDVLLKLFAAKRFPRAALAPAPTPETETR